MRRFTSAKESPMSDQTTADATGSDTFTRFQSAAEGVEGWFTNFSAAIFDSLLRLQDDNGITGDFLEIGVAYGRSALMLGVHAQPSETIRLVDPRTEMLAEAAARVSAVTRGSVIPLSSLSESLPIDHAPSRSSRFVHIDGDHSRWALHDDLDLAARTLVSGGIVALDDFFSARYIGVTYGAIEWLARNPLQFELILVGSNKGYLVRPRFAQFYLEFIRDKISSEIELRGEAPVTLFRVDNPRACVAFGIEERGGKPPYITREIEIGVPDPFPDGRYPV
jgi:predicted O-methyltransferase YrrM